MGADLRGRSHVLGDLLIFPDTCRLEDGTRALRHPDLICPPLSRQVATCSYKTPPQAAKGKLAKFMEAELQRPVQIAYAEALATPQIGGAETVDLVIGKFSVVMFDAKRAGRAIRPIAMLSGKDGSIAQHGLFVVRQNDAAKSIADLAGYRLLFGPEDSDEKRSAALAALEAFDVPVPEPIQGKASCSTAALAVANGYIVVADKDLDETHDAFRCLDADTGRQVWKISYPAAGRMDFTNSPRANPVIHDGLVYLLGAFGDLHCIQLTTGRVVWKKHLAQDYTAGRPTWGYCSAPLIVGDNLIVNPGAKHASLAALDRRPGELRWMTAGRAPGYACLVLAKLGGVRQIVGYDATTLGGWDPNTGKRLWELLPELDGDYNVPTPIVVADKRRFNCVAQLDMFDDVPREDRDVWSHPALVGNRLYVRNMLAVYCFLLNDP